MANNAGNVLLFEAAVRKMSEWCLSLLNVNMVSFKG